MIMLYGNEVIHMKCKDLLKNLEYECVRGSVDVEVTEVVNDSRKVSRLPFLVYCGS